MSINRGLPDGQNSIGKFCHEWRHIIEVRDTVFPLVEFNMYEIEKSVLDNGMNEVI